MAALVAGDVNDAAGVDVGRPRWVHLRHAVGIVTLYAEVEDDVEVEPVGELTLAGFQRPIQAFNVVAVREMAAELSQS